ncbi:MAG: hypothetical protein AAGI06_09370 [Pseudomonadota bacterium]
MAGRTPYPVWPPGADADKADYDRLKISASLLHLVKELYQCFPDHCAPASGHWLIENQQDHARLFDWVKEQGLVVGEISQCALTLSGHQAFRAALQELPDLATRFMAADTQLEPHESATLWLETLRRHFESTGRRL